MSIKAFKKIAQSTYQSARAQDNNEQFNNQFKDIPFLSGRRVQDIIVTTSTVKVDHKLGRMPLGYIILKQNADARIWYTAINDIQITFDSSATVTIDVWVF